MRKYLYYFILAVVVIIIDQVTKVLVHINMKMGFAGEIQLLGKWLRLHYTLNPGMAFGIKIGFKYGKLFLTSFRIFATYMIASYIPRLIRSAKVSPILTCGWVLIFGGAVGNIIDSVFYGIIFDNAPYDAPMKLFHGQVIDMIIVGIEHIYLPAWIPFIGGRYLPPFAVFNIADTAISTGVGLIILDNVINSIKAKYNKVQNNSKVN